MSNGPSHDESFRREIDARVGRTLCQRYTLEGVIGFGATSAVYRGSHRNGNRVAVKVLHTELSASKEARERFLRDAYVANQVEHPGALRVLDDDTAEDGTVFYVTDLLEGETLAEMLVRQGGTLQAGELVPLMSDLLDVLAAAHAKGVVHRAIAPSSIFITASRAVRVMDFGVDRLADGGRIATRIGRAMDASGYIAPEQARGETPLVDPQTDLWAVGAVMFRALTGNVAYRAETPQMVRIQAATQPAPALRSLVPSCDPGIAEIVDRALAWKKEERWSNAGAMQAALRSGRTASVQPPPVAAMPGSLPPPPAPGTWAPPPAPAPAPSPAQFALAPPAQQGPYAQQAPYPQQGPYGQAPPFNPAFAPPSTDNGWVKWAAGAAVLVILFVMGGGAALVLFLRSAAQHAKADAGAKAALVWSDEASPVPVSSRDPVWGRREAPVTVVVFSDFQCPFCARVEPTVEQVKNTYGAEKVRVVWKNQPLPFHQNARPAAEAAQVVFALEGSEAFFRFHDKAFKNQSQLTPDNFRLWAIEAGVNPQAFDKASATGAASLKVAEDMEIAKRVGATGTPFFRINGVELSGAQPFEKFQQLIDVELAKAAAKTAAGTKGDALYVALSTENFRKPAPPKKTEEDVEAADGLTVWRVPVLGAPVRGNVDAPVTIVEFGDFQCPFCKRSQQTLDKVRDHYGDKVRIVWKNQPLAFHRQAEPAAELALEARAQKGDAGFFRAHDALFESQPKLDEADLAKIGAQLGLDAAKVKIAIRDKKHKAKIDADTDLADDVKATGTPHFFINGRRLSGAQPFDKFQTVIDEELKKFEAKRGSVAAKDYYASLMRDAKGAPEPERKVAPPVPPGSPFRGGKNAKVVIQQWSDFQCPFCARVEPTLDEVLKEYGDRVKIVWRDKPLAMHPDAALAAELAREALDERGPQGFWKMHAKLFANQQKLKRDDLDVYAADLGLDKAKVARALDGNTHKAVIDADDRLGTEIGITGTPAFLINSYYLSGAQPLAKFRKVIDRALAETAP
jgi:protein-disulfide isomerase